MNREELESLKNKYEEVMYVLEKISTIHQFQRKRMIENASLLNKKKNMDLVEMNEWLYEIINFYKQNNIEISECDFRNMFSINNLSYYRINEIINRYMKVFFENINDLSSYKFNELVLHGMEDLGILNDTNPVIDEIIMGINKFNSEHKSYFNQIVRDSVGSIMDDINIKLLGLDNLDEIMNKLSIRIETLNSQIKLQDRDNNSNVDSSIDMDMTVDKGHNLLLYNLCMMITKNRYENMNDDEKNKILSRIPEIVEMIIKLRIFGHVKEEYLVYSKNANYKDVLEKITEDEKTVSISKKRLIELVSEKKDIESISYDKKGLLDVGFKKRVNKRDASIKAIDEKILNFGQNVVKYNEHISELKKEYLSGFYEKFGDISKLENEYNIRRINDTDKLFGVFDFKKLPPSSESINERFSDVMVSLPDMDSLEFKNISELSLRIMKYLNVSINEDDRVSEFDISLESVNHHRR